MTYIGDILASAQFLASELASIEDITQEPAYRKSELISVARALRSKSGAAIEDLGKDLAKVPLTRSGTHPSISIKSLLAAHSVLKDMALISEIEGFAGRALKNLERA